jgi:hypothetical protein
MLLPLEFSYMGRDAANAPSMREEKVNDWNFKDLCNQRSDLSDLAVFRMCASFCGWAKLSNRFPEHRNR